MMACSASYLLSDYAKDVQQLTCTGSNTRLALQWAPIVVSHGMQERREDLLRRLLEDLRVVCEEIGEDVKVAAAEVHPNLVYMW